MLIDEHRVVAAAPGDAQPVKIDLPGRWSDMDAATLGALLKNQLGSHRLSLGRVVVGVPVSWVLTQRLSVPSTDTNVAAGAVKMRVSRDYATDAGNLVADYTISRSSGASEVLIGVTTRKKLESLTKTLAEAGLTPVAIHVTAQAYVNEKQADTTLVRIDPPMAELALVRDGRTVGLRSLCDTLDNDPAGAARAITANIASDPQLSSNQSELVLASDPATGIDPHSIASYLNGVAGGSTSVIDESVIDAMRRRAQQHDMLDLLRCRASKETGRGLTKTQRIGVGVAALVVLLILAVGGLWWSREHRLSTLQATAAGMASDVEMLSEVKSRLDESAPWFDKRVDMLSCMQVLTECVPQRSELRLTEFRLNADKSGSLQGRAETRSQMLEFLRTMQASESLSSVALRDSAQTQNDRGEVRFEIVFNYIAGKGGR